MPQLTPAQIKAIQARGNVLVQAGAGTGKTRTLVERCVALVCDQVDRMSLENVLMVTFTEAAAAEMRQRLRDRLQERAAEAPEDSWLAEQLALVDTAAISTLHSFCLQLVREHFYALELDPQIAVLAEEQSALLERETFHGLLQEAYAGALPDAEAVQQLVLDHGRGWDEPVLELVLRLHHYTQTLRDPVGWFQRQLSLFEQPVPAQWEQWLRNGFLEWCDLWRPLLREQAAEDRRARQCADVLTNLERGSPTRRQNPSRSQMAGLLAQLLAVNDQRSGKQNASHASLKHFFEEAAFLHSVARVTRRSPQTPPSDPLIEDWNWVRFGMVALLKLTREFGDRYGRAKHELAAVDFHDLEQSALRLLWDPQSRRPTAIADEYRAKLRLVFVDEYQDINEAQDAILQALGREGQGANRFLVGDVKQSIYRFRLANPHIFQRYASAWKSDSGSGAVIPLADNFRSHEAILEFVNALFGSLMHHEVGGVEYDEAARLRFGAPAERQSMAMPPAPHGDQPNVFRPARIEFHLRLTDSARTENGEGEETNAAAENGLADLSNTEKEARLLALRLRELKAARFTVWDNQANRLRPAEWSDMVILLRSPRHKAEGYAKEFARLGVPLQASRSGFYEAAEITDLLSLLQILDNPLQDLPLLAVLRSPLVNLTLDELVMIRLAHRSSHFWTALRHFEGEMAEAPGEKAEDRGQKPEIRVPGARPQSSAAVTRSSEGDTQLAFTLFETPIAESKTNRNHPAGEHGSRTTDYESPATHASLSPTNAAEQDLRQKLALFLDRYALWRKMARQMALSQCLETILDETHYEPWLLAQSRGEQRQANVQRLLVLTRQFDQFQRQGLFRFLKFVEAQQEIGAEAEPASGSTADAVRLMSIHQSKGLEFPIVAVADLGKPFNFSELRAEVVLDEEFGLCPKIKPPHTGQRYPSLPYWLARRRQRRELIGEEIRLLYVACTRACDLLLLTGSASQKTVTTQWPQQTAAVMPPQQVLDARSYLDWLGAWLPATTGHRDWTMSGAWSWLAWRIYRPADPLEAVQPGDAVFSATASERSEPELSPEALRSLKKRLTWKYPFPVATREPAKTSVSVLRRRAAAEVDEDAQPFFEFQVPRPALPATERNRIEDTALSAADIGTAHHTFQQYVVLSGLADEAALRQEAERLVKAGLLSSAEREILDFAALNRFWQSELGRRIREQEPYVHRELPFTGRFSTADFARLGMHFPALGGSGPADSSDARGREVLPALTQGEIASASPRDEFVVVQGVVDLAVILPDGIWLLDYKTDQVSAAGVAEKTAKYRPQLALYALALSRIYGLTVTHRWLHFLVLGSSVSV